jgi:hypothetical protein
MGTGGPLSNTINTLVGLGVLGALALGSLAGPVRAQVQTYPDPAHLTGMPKRLGECLLTSIKKVETRLIDGSTGESIPDSGSAVEFANGGYQVSYGRELGIERSKAGDPVMICLVSIPENCPTGEAALNLRNRNHWLLPPDEHNVRRRLIHGVESNRMHEPVHVKGTVLTTVRDRDLAHQEASR